MSQMSEKVFRAQVDLFKRCPANPKSRDIQITTTENEEMWQIFTLEKLKKH